MASGPTANQDTMAAPVDAPPTGADSSAAGPRLICGLGNPGEQYVNTRHNIGFRVVEALSQRHGIALGGDTCRSRSGRGPLSDGPEVLLVQPQTYMNRSGFALRCLVERLEIAPRDVLVVYDEVHLPLGRLRVRPKGSPAGHRGLESILENMGGYDVPRLRIGVGETEETLVGEELVAFVLGAFQPEQSKEIDALIARAADACECWATRGAEAAMQAFNG